LYRVRAGQRERGGRPHWEWAFKVLDCDVVTDPVRDAGGNVMAPPFEVMEHLRMSVLADQEGAGFCLAQPRKHQGVGVVREPQGQTALNKPGTVGHGGAGDPEPWHDRALELSSFGAGARAGRERRPRDVGGSGLLAVARPHTPR